MFYVATSANLRDENRFLLGRMATFQIAITGDQFPLLKTRLYKLVKTMLLRALELLC